MPDLTSFLPRLPDPMAKYRRLFSGEQPQPPPSELTPETEAALTKNVVLGGLEAVGNVLDAPRRFVWQIPAWMGGSDVNPLEAVLEPSKAVKGEDITGNSWTGLGLEILGDPLILATGVGSALTKLGKGASKAAKIGNMAEAVAHAQSAAAGTQKAGRVMGSSVKAMADEVRRGERAIGKYAGQEFGTGSETAARALELGYYGSLSPIPYIRSLVSRKSPGDEMLFEGTSAFRKAVAKQEGVTTLKSKFYQGGMFQQMARDDRYSMHLNNVAALNDTLPAIRKGLADVEETAAGIMPYLKAVGNKREFSEVGNIVQYIGEMRTAGSAIGGAPRPMGVEDVLGLMSGADDLKAKEFATKTIELVDGIKGIHKAYYGRIYQMGGGDYLDQFSMVQHFQRGMHPELRKFAEAAAKDIEFGREFPTVGGTQLGRKPWLEHPGGSEMNDRIARSMASGYQNLPETMAKKVKATKAVQGFHPGDWVLATDRNNYGRVVELNDDTADIIFRSPDGAIATKSLPYDILKNQTGKRGAGPAVRVALPMSKAEVKESLTVQGYLTEGVDVRDALANFLSEKVIGPTAKALQEQGRLSPEEYAKWAKAWKEEGLGRTTVNFFGKLPLKAQALGFHDPNIVRESTRRVEMLSMAHANLTAVHKMYLDGTAIVNNLDKIPKGLVSMDDAFNRAVSKSGKRIFSRFEREVPDGLGGVTKVVEEPWKQYYLDGLAKQLQTQDAAKWGAMGADDAERMAYLGQHAFVDENVPAFAAKYFVAMDPQEGSWIGKVMNTWSKAFRSGVTTMFGPIAAAFHVRNRVDGIMRNIGRSGPNMFDLKDYGRHEIKTNAVMFGRRNPEKLENLEGFVREGLLERTMISDSANASLVQPTNFADVFAPILQPKKYWAEKQALKAQEAGTEIEKIPGFLKRTVLALPESGKQAYQFVEFLNRYPLYSALLDSGKSSSQAAHLVREIQYQYGPRSGAHPAFFRDRIARTAFPFFSFIQNNIPYQFSRLLNEPGGLTAQTLRMFNVAQESSGEYVPSWMREQMGIKLGGEGDKASYLRSVGLSVEPALNWLAVKPGLLGPLGDLGLNKRTVEKILAQSHPAAIMALKELTGKDPYSGRQIKDLVSAKERLPGLDYIPGATGMADSILSASPAARLGSIYQTAVDPRKDLPTRAMNLLTGLRVGTYNVEMQKAIDLQKASEQMLEENPLIRKFTAPYVPKALEGQVTPETQQQLETYRQISRKIKALAEKRAKAKGK